MWFFSLSVVTDRLTGSTVFFFHTHAQCKDRQTNGVFFFPPLLFVSVVSSLIPSKKQLLGMQGGTQNSSTQLGAVKFS